ncbi:helix-turn-helix domain-containing protein [Streptomyces sp. G5(2025)]|uniref:helix-turn-helix domain-containing protein n=1 Tax=Streptomyces sp. G5(2025) TaxID=3406628 RepID=UPI003C187B0B
MDDTAEGAAPQPQGPQGPQGSPGPPGPHGSQGVPSARSAASSAQSRPLDGRAELSEFLRSRRARLQPQDVGLPSFGRHRRVPGLRREELAQLAGVSVAYYTRLEQGNGRNVSGEVLDAIARALRLSDAEHAHLTHLAKPKALKKKRATRRQHMRPALQALLDSIEGVPAYVVGRRSDILGWNAPAAALFGDWGDLDPKDRNWARICFLDARSPDLFVDWEQKASDIVSFLRMDAGCYPNDPELSALVGELSVKSEDFRRLWATHDVKEKGHGVKRMRHPLVGELTLSYETLRLPDDCDQSLVMYHAEPGSASAQGLRLLASWGKDASSVGSGAK